MLYPLSYEGLRPISYRPGDTHECPGVPSGAHRCHLGRRWRSVAGRRTRGAFFAHTRPGLPGGDHGCPALISGVIHSPSTSGALATAAELGNTFGGRLDVREGSRDRSCTGTAGCDSCGSVAGAPHARGAPARGFSPLR
jgi:hypothetical protein